MRTLHAHSTHTAHTHTLHTHCMHMHMHMHRLQNYVTFSFGVSRGISIQEVTASLPETVRGEVLYLMHEQLLRKVPMFRDTDDMFIKALVRTLQPQVLLRGDYLFRMNEPGDCMFFIKNGCVQIKNLDGTVVFASLMPGAFLGELSMLTGQRRSASAQAIADCVLFLMRTIDFDEVMKDLPSYLGSILEGAMWSGSRRRSRATLQPRTRTLSSRQGGGCEATRWQLARATRPCSQLRRVVYCTPRASPSGRTRPVRLRHEESRGG